MEQIRMRRLFIQIFLLFFGGITFPAYADDESHLRIAYILPLSGDWAFLGNGIRDGALLAKADLEKDNFHVELIFEDNRGDLTASATAATRLVSDGKVDAFISIISGVGKLLKPIAEKAQIINIGICSDTEVADGHYSFINYLTAEQGAVKYIDYFSNTIGRGKAVGIYAMNEAGFQKIVDELHARAADAMQIRFTEHFDKGVSDFRPVLLRNQSQRPDALLILGLSPEIELLARQGRSIGINTPFTSIEGFGLSNDKSAFEGAWFVDSAVPHYAFRERFQNTYRREVTPGVGHSYDSVHLLAKAFGYGQTNAPSDRANAVQHFREISEFTGVTGKLRVRSDGVIWGDASVKKIVNGQPVLAAP
jgi:branched-chain amino acid transport system substrate-binding protein